MHEPLIVHLVGVKDNRLLSCRAVAFEYQEERPDCTIDEYVLRRGRANGEPAARSFERLACQWLNSWGRGIPRTPEHGRMPAVLDRLRNVVVCEWQDGVILRRDDSGWDPRHH
jgi:hypothetical protein